jgi:hypothetical protein
MKMDENELIEKFAMLYWACNEESKQKYENEAHLISWDELNEQCKNEEKEIMKQFLKKVQPIAKQASQQIQVFPNVRLKKEQKCLECGCKTLNGFLEPTTKKIFPACVKCAPGLIERIFR